MPCEHLDMRVSDDFFQSIIQANSFALGQLVKQVRSPLKVVPFVGAGLSIPFGFPGWSTFLMTLATAAGLKMRTGRHIASGRFEEAAEELEKHLGPRAFADEVVSAFGRSADSKESREQLGVLAELTCGPMVTTNLDRVLEASGEDRSWFKNVVWGGRIAAALDDLNRGGRLLLKLHGDAFDPTDRLLTLTEYCIHYGAARPVAFDPARPLPRLLDILFKRQPLLFVGCSLGTDRTIAVLRHVFSRNPELCHYAIVEEPRTDVQKQRKSRILSEVGIRPIWYPHGQHLFIRVLLSEVLKQAKLLPNGPDLTFNVESLRTPMPMTRRLGIAPHSTIAGEDLLTPVSDSQTLYQRLRGAMEPALAKRLCDLHFAALDAVIRVDFEQQIQIGNELLAIGTDHPTIRSAGHYFVGEGLRWRVLWTNPTDSSFHSDLEQAENEFKSSEDCVIGQARALRALGRVQEVKGDYGRALQTLLRAKQTAAHLASEFPTESGRMLASHEMLRISRHYINCIVGIIKSNKLSRWRSKQKMSELERLITESEDLHQRVLRQFAFQPDWCAMEWFWALTFLADAWGEVGNGFRMDLCLLQGLRARMLTIPIGREISGSERRTLAWWATAAKAPLAGRSSFIIQAAESLGNLIEHGLDSEIHFQISRILAFVALSGVDIRNQLNEAPLNANRT
jgi:hypothetical protein